MIGMSERLTLPVFPLREVVLFPGVTTSLGAGRPGTVRAVEAALATPERLVFAICQRENVEQVTSEGLYTIGTIAKIGQLQTGPSMPSVGRKNWRPHGTTAIVVSAGMSPNIGASV